LANNFRHGAVPNNAAPDSPPIPSNNADELSADPKSPANSGSGTVIGAGSVVVVRTIVVEVVDEVVVVASTATVAGGW
jgi:hypothetical protein